MSCRNLLIALLAAVPMAFPVQASDRYQSRPPVIVSPDLTAPWVLQLGGVPAAEGRQMRRVERRAPQARQTVPAYAREARQGIAAPAPVQQRRIVSQRRGLFTAEPTVRKVVSRPQRPAKPQIEAKFLPQMVSYDTPQAPGTIVIDTRERFLYLVMADGQAKRYGVGVGKPGFEWAGTHKVTAKKEWPDWTPPQEMITREAAKGHFLPNHMPGGPENPLGARALYLGSTLYRIHGTNAPWSIGSGVSSGCIRMRNEDVIDLYDRVPTGAKVIVI